MVFMDIPDRAIDVTRGKAFANHAFSLDDITHEPVAGNVELQAIQNIESEKIREVVASLPDVQSEAISLAYFSGYTNQEISDITGVPLGTVKGRIRLGMNKLRSTVVPNEEVNSANAQRP